MTETVKGMREVTFKAHNLFWRALYKTGLPNLVCQSPNLLNLESDVALMEKNKTLPCEQWWNTLIPIGIKSFTVSWDVNINSYTQP